MTNVTTSKLALTIEPNKQKLKYPQADNWKRKFIDSAKEISESKKKSYTYEDALEETLYPTPFDKVCIQYFEIIDSMPIDDNAFIKYVSTYESNGVKLQEKYFPYDLDMHLIHLPT